MELYDENDIEIIGFDENVAAVDLKLGNETRHYVIFEPDPALDFGLTEEEYKEINSTGLNAEEVFPEQGKIEIWHTVL
jgi:hypothetical protein